MEQPAPIVWQFKLIFHPFLTNEVIFRWYLNLVMNLSWGFCFFFFICFGVSIWERNKNRSFRAYSLYKPNWLKLIYTWAELHMTECLPKQTDRNSFSQYFVGKWPLNFAVYWKWFTPNGRDVCKVQFNQNPLNKIQSLKRLEEASCLQNYIL